jgi:hypothetical protein
MMVRQSISLGFQAVQASGLGKKVLQSQPAQHTGQGRCIPRKSIVTIAQVEQIRFFEMQGTAVIPKEVHGPIPQPDLGIARIPSRLVTGPFGTKGLNPHGTKTHQTVGIGIQQTFLESEPGPSLPHDIQANPVSVPNR